MNTAERKSIMSNANEGNVTGGGGGGQESRSACTSDLKNNIRKGKRGAMR